MSRGEDGDCGGAAVSAERLLGPRVRGGDGNRIRAARKGIGRGVRCGPDRCAPALAGATDRLLPLTEEHEGPQLAAGHDVVDAVTVEVGCHEL